MILVSFEIRGIVDASLALSSNGNWQWMLTTEFTVLILGPPASSDWPMFQKISVMGHGPLSS